MTMEQRERVIHGATLLFAQHGVRAVRMDDIATELSMSKRTLYEMFQDKKALIRECIAYYQDHLQERREEAFESSDNIFEEFLSIFDKKDPIVKANYTLMKSIELFYPNLYEEFGKDLLGFDYMRERLKQGIEDGLLLPDIDYDLAVSIFSHSIYGIFTQRNSFIPQNVSNTEAYRYVMVYFFRGLATEKGIAVLDKLIAERKKGALEH